MGKAASKAFAARAQSRKSLRFASAGPSISGCNEIHPTLPDADTNLRWDAFVKNLAKAHEVRSEGQEAATKAAIEEAAEAAGEEVPDTDGP